MMKKRNALWALMMLVFVYSSFSVLAHGSEDAEVFDDSFRYVIIASSIVAVMLAASILIKEKTEALKVILFVGISVPVILVTAYMTASTVYLNLKSETKGPVHWHADFEVWNCGEKIDLVDPSNLVNRVGTADFHDHDDDRVHVEGTIYSRESIDLHSFFEAVGGELESTHSIIPTDSGPLEIYDGQLCNGMEGKLQVFLYRITNPNAYAKSGFFYEQEKLDDFEDYVLSPYFNVPPGDCIIIEFGEEKPFTDKVCESYRVAEESGDIARQDGS